MECKFLRLNGDDEVGMSCVKFLVNLPENDPPVFVRYVKTS